MNFLVSKVNCDGNTLFSAKKKRVEDFTFLKKINNVLVENFALVN